MVTLDQVTKRYAGLARPALDCISLSISSGEFIYLTGPSGAGKTTLLRILFGAEIMNSGRVLVAGFDLGFLKTRSLVRLRRKIGVIFQEFKLIPGLSVFENVALPLRVSGVGGPPLKARVMEVLANVGLHDRPRATAGSLSGGEQQRIAIARALAPAPPLILADEPTGNLDPDNGHEIVRLLVKAHGYGTTVIIATHDPDILTMVGGARVVRLSRGRLEEMR